MSNVRAMPISGQCNSNDDVAAFLRRIAEQIEEGDRGDIRTVVMTLEVSGEGMTTLSAGKGGLDNARVLGLLFLAMNTYMEGQE